MSGKSVSIAGSTHEGETELDVETVDGTALRAPGKPPWAGGPWVVGETHPGWKPWMADGKPGKGHGRENAPGQLKKANRDALATGDSTDNRTRSPGARGRMVNRGEGGRGAESERTSRCVSEQRTRSTHASAIHRAAG